MDYTLLQVLINAYNMPRSIEDKADFRIHSEGEMYESNQSSSGPEYELVRVHQTLYSVSRAVELPVQPSV